MHEQFSCCPAGKIIFNFCWLVESTSTLFLSEKADMWSQGSSKGRILHGQQQAIKDQPVIFCCVIGQPVILHQCQYHVIHQYQYTYSIPVHQYQSTSTRNTTLMPVPYNTTPMPVPCNTTRTSAPVPIILHQCQYHVIHQNQCTSAQNTLPVPAPCNTPVPIHQCQRP